LRPDDIYGEHVKEYVMEPAYALDIDTPADLQLAEWMIVKQNLKSDAGTL